MSAFGDLMPMDTLFEVVLGAAMPLTDRLAAVYGRLEFPPPGERPYVIGSVSSTLDGIQPRSDAGQTGAGLVSSRSAHSRFLLGLLRASVDAVIIGTESLAADPLHRWTPEAAFPDMGDEYHQLRTRLGKTGYPATVVVTSRGEISLDLPVFQIADSPISVLTTEAGMNLLERQERPGWVRVIPVKPAGLIQAEEILVVLARVYPGSRYLVEGGPHLFGTFFDSRCLDELFLALSPEFIWREAGQDEKGLAAEHGFSSEKQIIGSLYSVKRADSHLFLRYGFPTTKEG